MAPRPWEIVDHTADWAIRAWGADLSALLTHAAEGMLVLIGGSPDERAEPVALHVTLQAPDPETLLVDLLTELLVAVEERELVFSEVAVEALAEGGIRVAALGRPGGGFSHHVKAVTYHNLAIEPTDDGLAVTVVFDV